MPKCPAGIYRVVGAFSRVPPSLAGTRTGGRDAQEVSLRQGKARHGMVRQGKARQCKAASC